MLLPALLECCHLLPVLSVLPPPALLLPLLLPPSTALASYRCLPSLLLPEPCAICCELWLLKVLMGYSTCSI